MALTSATLYLAVRLGSVLQGAGWTVWMFTAVLLVGEAFFVLHGFGYATNLLRGARFEERGTVRSSDTPAVAVFVSSYNEPVDVLRATLTAALAMDYDQKRIYLIDDSTKPQLVDELRALCNDLGVVFFHRNHRRGFKAGALNDALNATREPLLMILDADQRPEPGFLRENVSVLLGNPHAAYVQTPQVYANVGDGLVAFAAEVQHTSFYEFGCVGKAVSDAAFYLGTNVIIRREAVVSAGGFAEDSVTEDLVTSYRMHKKGWKLVYRRKTGVRGLGPTNLTAYFNQQYRWAFGTLRLFPEWLGDLRRARTLHRFQRWEYFLTISWWLQGWGNLALMALPPAFFFLGARVLGPDVWVYVAALTPFLVFFTLLNVLALRGRGHSARGLVLGQALALVSFPVYIKAFFDAIRGKRVPFKVTSKRRGIVYVRFRTLSPQLGLFLFNAAGVGIGLWIVIGEPVLVLVLLFGGLLALTLVWEALSKARELEPLRIAQQRRAWRALQLEIAILFAVSIAFLLGLNLMDVAARTPDVLGYFSSQWALAAARAWALPEVLFNMFWAAHNCLFLYGLFLFRVGIR